MTGRIWSALVATGLALGVTATTPAAESAGPGAGASPVEVITSPPPAEADAVPDGSQVGPRTDRATPVANIRALLAVAAIAVALGLVGALAVRRPPDTRRPVPTRARRHGIASRAPPAVAA